MSDKDSLLEFPCQFPIKAIGTGADLDVLVYSIVSRHVPNLSEGALTKRASGKGNFTAVTVTITANSRTQLDNIYLELTAHERIHVAL